MAQAIEQATCEHCNDEDNEFRMTDSDTIQGDVSGVKYDVTCSCQESAIITIDMNGTHAGRGVNHEDASWNNQ